MLSTRVIDNLRCQLTLSGAEEGLDNLSAQRSPSEIISSLLDQADALKTAQAPPNLNDDVFTKELEKLNRECYARIMQKPEIISDPGQVEAAAQSGPSPFLDLTEHVSKTDLDELDAYLQENVVGRQCICRSMF